MIIFKDKNDNWLLTIHIKDKDRSNIQIDYADELVNMEE